MAGKIARAREILPQVHYRRSDLATIAYMMGDVGVDGHRADLVILKTAVAQAAWEGRKHVTDQDIMVAAQLALPHRLKRRPFEEDTETTTEELERRVEEARERAEEDQVEERESLPPQQGREVPKKA